MKLNLNFHILHQSNLKKNDIWEKSFYNNTHWLKSYLENKMMLWYVCNFIYETSFGQMIILIEAKQKRPSASQNRLIDAFWQGVEIRLLFLATNSDFNAICICKNCHCHKVPDNNLHTFAHITSWQKYASIHGNTLYLKSHQFWYSQFIRKINLCSLINWILKMLTCCWWIMSKLKGCPLGHRPISLE